MSARPRKYDLLGPTAFGRELVVTRDLDPVYVMLHRALGPDDAEELARWLVAYWLSYDVGFASWATDQRGRVDYWDGLHEAARNRTAAPDGGRWTRGRERRHWRGDNAVKAVVALASRYGDKPLDFVRYLAEGGPCDYRSVAARVDEHYLFGPWIAFKIADMLDRLGLAAVDFTGDDIVLFDDPRAGARMVWRHVVEPGEVDPDAGRDPFEDPAEDAERIAWSVAYVQDGIGDLQAPPLYERRCSLQEVETVLCKWKSHVRGHYAVGNDIRELRHSLARWAPFSTTARLLLTQMPPLVGGEEDDA